MGISSKIKIASKWDNLNYQGGNKRATKSWCAACGDFHLSNDHWRFMAEDMPKEPVDMISDLVKMGVYQPETLKLAEAINAADLRKELFLKIVGKGDRRREKLVQELVKQAGGLENAVAAAFGTKAGEFFGDVTYHGQFSRRRFLKNLAVGAALVRVC